MRLMEIAKEQIAKIVGTREKQREEQKMIVETAEKFLNPPMENPAFPNLPLTYQEMLLVVPAKIMNPKHPKHKAVLGLLQNMARHLEDARTVSKIPAESYSRGFSPDEMPAQTSFRIRGIQQQMSAVRFRLDIHDCQGILEEKILQARLHELYEQAKVVDPQGTTRFERMIDKRMRKARARV